MGKGSSSQSRGSSSMAAPGGSAAATAGMRRRRGGSKGGGGPIGDVIERSSMLKFYTDDAPGLKISPTTVLVMSIGFIAFVISLHVFGKLYRKSSAAHPQF